jgi:hypothetical protein
VYEVLVPAIVGPGLVGAATLAARRWGQRVGGVVSALPAIVGPVLLISAERHGTAFAAQAATGTLLGLAALSGFALVYGRIALRGSWPWSLAGAWLAATTIGAMMDALDVGLVIALPIAVASLALAHRGLPALRVPTAGEDRSPLDLVLRMTLTAALILVLAATAGRVGPTVSGILAALPVLACILATFVHARHGGAAAVQLLRGMLSGMAGFVVFCVLVAALIGTMEVGATFAVAGGAALAVPGVMLSLGRTERAPERVPPRSAGPLPGTSGG